MSATVLYMSMSLDGFVAGPNESVDNGLGDGGDRLHEWFFSGAPTGHGGVREERLVLGRPPDAPIARTAHAGSSFAFGAGDIHRVLHAGTEPAVTIHAYSPPLSRMGSYTIEPDGRLRRHAVSYEQELRELSATS
jgi:hypothetical protein